jgi:histidyl-tRNA synthetase
VARDLSVALRDAGLRVDRGFEQRSLKAQLKVADRSGARVALIVGPAEAAAGTVTVRPLRGGGEQRAVPNGEVADVVRTMRGASS